MMSEPETSASASPGMLALPDLEQHWPLNAAAHIYELPIFGRPVYEHLIDAFLHQSPDGKIHSLHVHRALLSSDTFLTFANRRGVDLPSIHDSGPSEDYCPTLVLTDRHDIGIEYPWHLFDVQDYLAESARAEVSSDAVIEDGVEISGPVTIEDGAHICSGARLKGNVYIGRNTFIGNNVLIRGNTSIGRDCLIGFGAEIKNAILGDDVSVAPTSGVQDSVLGCSTWLGGVTRTINTRMDNGSIRAQVKGDLVETGRSKFGTVTGRNARLGGGVSTLPGRMIGQQTLIGPRVLVEENIPDHCTVRAIQTVSVKSHLA